MRRRLIIGIFGSFVTSHPLWHLTVWRLFLSACSSPGNADSLKTLTSSFSRSAVACVFWYLATASHLLVLAKAPAIVYCINPLFFFFLFKALIFQGPFQCYLAASDLYCQSRQCVPKAAAQEVCSFPCVLCHVDDKSALGGQWDQAVFKIQRGEAGSWKWICHPYHSPCY